MATSIKLDRNCDIVFDANGVCEVVSDNEDIIQAIRVELEQNKGQWALNKLYGMPYLNSTNTGLLQVKNSEQKIRNELVKLINKYNVDSIESIIFDKNEIEVKIKLKGEVYTL